MDVLACEPNHDRAIEPYCLTAVCGQVGDRDGEWNSIDEGSVPFEEPESRTAVGNEPGIAPMRESKRGRVPNERCAIRQAESNRRLWSGIAALLIKSLAPCRQKPRRTIRESGNGHELSRRTCDLHEEQRKNCKKQRTVLTLHHGSPVWKVGSPGSHRATTTKIDRILGAIRAESGSPVIRRGGCDGRSRPVPSCSRGRTRSGWSRRLSLRTWYYRTGSPENSRRWRRPERGQWRGWT